MSPASPYEDELFTHPTEISGTVFVNDRVCIQTEEDQRVISVHGVVFSHYSIKVRTAEAHALVARVPLGDARKGQEAVKLSTERKHLTNVLKMVAYQIESDLVELIRPEYKRVEDEGRTFIQTGEF
jgi:hypothetical protein